MKKENWKDIDGYEGYYQISDLGRVKSLNRISIQNITIKERILKSYNNKSNKGEKGYLYVDLNKDGETKRFYIHRLVANAFLDNQNNYPEVNHKDCDTFNNDVDNLEWCTRKYNHSYGDTLLKRSLSRKGKNKGKENKNSRRVICLTTEKIFDCIREAADYYGLQNSRNAISGCCKGKHKYIGKLECGTPLVWMYYDEYIKDKEGSS